MSTSYTHYTKRHYDPYGYSRSRVASDEQVVSESRFVYQFMTTFYAEITLGMFISEVSDAVAALGLALPKGINFEELLAELQGR